MQGKPERIAILFAQFAAYHIDRCEAVARRMGSRAEVLAVEVATTSATYAWEASGEVAGARKITLFPGASYDSVPWPRRLWREFKALWRCDRVLIGIGYDQRDVIVLSWLLALVGAKVILLSESKFDDRSRAVGFELFKSLLLSPYRAAIVGASRQSTYFRFLGFRRRPVLPGYDTVGIDRIRGMSKSTLAPDGMPFDQRSFVYVGRFVKKKNLVELVGAYALYSRACTGTPRRLVLIGSGEEEPAIRSAAEDHGVIGQIDFPGFLSAPQVATQLADGLCLVLPSLEEQWGLVVNEALALNLPVIASTAVGSVDLLVRNLVNGYVVEPGSAESLARALTAMGESEMRWREMSAASKELAWLGDTERLADAVEVLVDPAASEAQERVAEVWRNGACKSGVA